MEEFLVDPISRVYAIISGLVVIMIAVVGFNFSQDAKNRDNIYKAQLAAANARPFPYTSQMASINNERIRIDFAEKIELERQLHKAELLALEFRIKNMITELEIPPEEVKIRLQNFEDSIHNIRIQMREHLAKLAENAH